MAPSKILAWRPLWLRVRIKFMGLYGWPPLALAGFLVFFVFGIEKRVCFIFRPKKMHIFSVYFIFQYKYGRKNNRNSECIFHVWTVSIPYVLSPHSLYIVSH